MQRGPLEMLACRSGTGNTNRSSRCRQGARGHAALLAIVPKVGNRSQWQPEITNRRPGKTIQIWIAWAAELPSAATESEQSEDDDESKPTTHRDSSFPSDEFEIVDARNGFAT